LFSKESVKKKMHYPKRKRYVGGELLQFMNYATPITLGNLGQLLSKIQPEYHTRVQQLARHKRIRIIDADIWDDRNTDTSGTVENDVIIIPPLNVDVDVDMGSQYNSVNQQSQDTNNRNHETKIAKAIQNIIANASARQQQLWFPTTLLPLPPLVSVFEDSQTKIATSPVVENICQVWGKITTPADIETQMAPIYQKYPAAAASYSRGVTSPPANVLVYLRRCSFTPTDVMKLATCAVKSKLMDVLKFMLSQYRDVMQPENLAAMLWHAVMARWADGVAALVAGANADINFMSPRHHTPLAKAAELSALGVIQAMAVDGKLAQAANTQLVVWDSIVHDRYNVVKLLLELGCDPNGGWDTDGQCVPFLALAAQMHQLKYMALLLAHHARIDGFYNTAAAEDHPNTPGHARAMIRHYQSTTHQDHTRTLAAVQQLPMLARHMYAFYTTHHTIYGETSTAIASSYWTTQCAGYESPSGDLVIPEGMCLAGANPLMVAIASGYAIGAQWLIARGALVDVVDDGGRSPLWLAMKHRLYTLVDTLLPPARFLTPQTMQSRSYVSRSNVLSLVAPMDEPSRSDRMIAAGVDQ
jgi:hypothetical protein